MHLPSQAEDPLHARGLHKHGADGGDVRAHVHGSVPGAVRCAVHGAVPCAGLGARRCMTDLQERSDSPLWPALTNRSEVYPCILSMRRREMSKWEFELTRWRRRNSKSAAAFCFS